MLKTTLPSLLRTVKIFKTCFCENKRAHMLYHVERDSGAGDGVLAVVLNGASDPDVLTAHEARLLNRPVKGD